MHARTAYKTGSISHRELRRVRALRSPPVDPFQQHRQLRRDSSARCRSRPAATRSDRARAAWQTDTAHRRPTTTASPDRRADRGTRTAVPRTDLRPAAAARSRPVHRSPCACRSRRTQARSAPADSAIIACTARAVGRAVAARARREDAALPAPRSISTQSSTGRAHGRRAAPIRALPCRPRDLDWNQCRARALAPAIPARTVASSEHQVRVHLVTPRNHRHRLPALEAPPRRSVASLRPCASAAHRAADVFFAIKEWTCPSDLQVDTYTVSTTMHTSSGSRHPRSQTVETGSGGALTFVPWHVIHHRRLPSKKWTPASYEHACSNSIGVRYPSAECRRVPL